MAAVTIAATCAPAASTTAYAPPAAGTARSARLLVSDSALIATHPASSSVAKVLTGDGAVEWRRDIGCVPATVAEIGELTAVACSDSGEVVLLDATGSAMHRRKVGHGAFGLLFAGRLYVTLSHEDALVALDPATLAEIDRAPTDLLPRGIAVKDDILYVIHSRDARIRSYDPRDLAPLATIDIGQQAGVAESVTPHPIEPRLYAPHTRLNVTNRARQFDTTVFPTVASIDVTTGSAVRRESLSLDSVDTPVGMPLAVAIDALRGRLYSANASSDDVSVVDLGKGIGVGHIDVGERPRDIAISADGASVYTLDQHGGTITVIDASDLTATATITYATDPRPQDIRQGERLFTTSRPRSLARDRWISCSTCHLDGGADGQTWLGTEDGPRNTPTLRGIAGTEPFHWSGDRPDIASFQRTVTDVMAGTGLSDVELAALDRFIASLEPLASPHRDDDRSLTTDAESGAATFQRVGCTSCHAPPLFTDRRLHDVGTGSPTLGVPERRGASFKAPSLRELWLTAPYLHDGRAATLSEAVALHSTSLLSNDEMEQLEAFLLQLPLTSEETRRLFGH